MERPILMSGPLVVATLAGRKVETRRPAKDRDRLAGRCPFGVAGDRLWVRETWAPFHVGQKHATACPVEDVDDADAARYMADGRVWMCESGGAFAPADDGGWVYAEHRWRPSIHMPRWASRLTLDIVEVRCERLHDVDGEGAVREGFEASYSWAGVTVMVEDGGTFWQGELNPAPVPKVGDLVAGMRVVHVQPTPRKVSTTAREFFAMAWRSIYGADSWDANPWVWVVRWKPVTP
jgi:hypothetical protein